MRKLRLPKGIKQVGNKLYFLYYDPSKKKTYFKSSGLTATRDNVSKVRKMKDDYKSYDASSGMRAPAYIPIGELLTNYLAIKQIANQGSYKSAVKHLIAVSGEKTVDDYTIADYDKFVIELRSKGYKHNTVAGYVNALVAMFNFAIERGHLAKNPFKRIEPVKNEIIVLDEKDLTELMKFIKERNPDGYLLVKTLLVTGLRISEALDLEYNDINLRDKIIRVKHGKSRDNWDYMPMTPDAYAHFEKLYEKKKGKVHKYTHRDVSFFKRLQKELWGEARYTLHHLRKTYVTNLVNSGVGVRDAMAYSRHKRVQVMFDYYAKAENNKIAEKYFDRIKKLDV